MNYGSASKVKGAKRAYPSADAPDPVSYWVIDKSTVKIIIVLNFILSANAPVIKAGVIMANMAWNIMKTDAGIVAA